MAVERRLAIENLDLDANDRLESAGTRDLLHRTFSPNRAFFKVTLSANICAKV